VNPVSRGNIVSCRIRFKLVQKPQALLRRSKWHIAASWQRNDRRALKSVLMPALLFDMRRQRCNGRKLEELAQRQLNVES
jgi:hypothetical protein